jgi:hypothetical protein
MPYQSTGPYSRKFIPTGEAGAGVVGGEVEEYKAPEFDLGRIKELTQEQLSPTVSKVRRAIQSVQAGRYGSPTARGVVTRQAIRGGGEALGGAQAGATQAALNIYGPQYKAQVQEALLRYQKKLSEREARKEETLRQSRDIGGETYATATRRLLVPQAGFNRGVGDLKTTSIPRQITDYSSQLLG